MTSANRVEAAHPAFLAELERHRGIVLRVAATYCDDAAGRADLVQEIAAQLWRAWPKYDPARRLTTWMYRIALNVAISFARDEGRHRRSTVPFDPELHDVADANVVDHGTDERLQALQRFIASQAPIDRALLLLYLDERPQAEIASILGLSETNVSTKIGRLKQRIRDTL